MELFISWCHFLNISLANRIATDHLGCSFTLVTSHVLNNGFSPRRSIINDCSSQCRLKSHLHRHSCCLCLLSVLGLKLLHLNFIQLSVGIMEDEDAHGVAKILWIHQANLKATFTKFVLWFLSILF